MKSPGQSRWSISVRSRKKDISELLVFMAKLTSVNFSLFYCPHLSPLCSSSVFQISSLSVPLNLRFGVGVIWKENLVCWGKEGVWEIMMNEEKKIWRRTESGPTGVHILWFGRYSFSNSWMSFHLIANRLQPRKFLTKLYSWSNTSYKYAMIC